MSDNRQAHLNIPLPDEMYARARAIIDEVRSADNKRRHSAEMGEVIIKLTEYSMEYSYIKSLSAAGIGFLKINLARSGLKTALGGISMVVKKVIKGMDDEQLMSVADFMEQMLFAPEDGEEA